VRCSVGRNSTRLNRLRNISQVAVLGQLVSDGAHSILDPAGREICAFLGGPKDQTVLCTLTLLRKNPGSLEVCRRALTIGIAAAWLVE